MKNLKFIVCLIYLIVGFNAFAQDDLFLNHYIFYQQTFNPAAIAQDGELGLFIYGDKNFNLENAPYTFMGSAYKSFRNNNLDVGLSYIRNLLGIERKTYLLGDAAYGFELAADRELKIGIKSGLLNHDLPLTEFQLYPDGKYDPVFAKDINDNYLVIGLGVFYSSNIFMAGVSSPQIAQLRINKGDNKKFNYNSPLLVFGQYNFLLTQKLILQPGFLLKVNKNVPDSYLPSLTFQYDERFWVGSSYDFRNSVNLLSRWVLKNGFGIGYSYIFVTGTHFPEFFSRHSLSLSYDLKLDEGKVNKIH